MNARAEIILDKARLNAALTKFPRERAMFIAGRDDKGQGETIERLSPAHGVLVTRMPRGTKADAERAIAAARRAFEHGAWSARDRFPSVARVAEDR